MIHPGKHQDNTAVQVTDASACERQHGSLKGPRRRSSALRFFASGSPPKHEPHAPSQKQWEVNYLKSLRTNRPARPGGSRPLPERNAASAQDPYAGAASAMSVGHSLSNDQPAKSKMKAQDRSTSALSHRRAPSDMPHPIAQNSIEGTASGSSLHKRRTTRDFSAATTSTTTSSTVAAPSLAYRESGLRWMEKQEAKSLREALEDMDLREEAKVHAAAQNEASELVLNHMNNDFPLGHAEPRRNYKEHLEKGAHARSQYQGWYDSPTDLSGTVVSSTQSESHNSSSSTGDASASIETTVISSCSSGPDPQSNDIEVNAPRNHEEWDSAGKKAYTKLAFQLPTAKSARRRSSGPRTRDPIGGPFRNPDDKIYEETDDDPKETRARDRIASNNPTPLTAKARESMANLQNAAQKFLPPRKVSDERQIRPTKVHRSEIYRNPPSQSRDPSYVSNSIPQTTNEAFPPEKDDKPRTKDGMEIRGDDIRAATSMRMSDRSPKLPSPTVVSGRPGRPIVSFDEDWKPKHSEKEDDVSIRRPAFGHLTGSAKPDRPTSTTSAPVIPTVNDLHTPRIFIDAPPPDVSIPSISVSGISVSTSPPADEHPKARPLPSTADDPRSALSARPLLSHSSTAPVQMTSVPHWTPAYHRATAQCAACALPISGRIVSAASQRFHPHCFICHHCAEPLECVAFYPEPEDKRTERLARIEARINDTDVLEDETGQTIADDGDHSLRFYCHLDYHELYSPRCRSCKTPIETEVVIACGGSWHVGHFFCAECGDPFDAQTPFVEKEGYAWCVKCHTSRFSGKCRGCRKPVVEQGVTALGAEWHEGCFVCVVCDGPG